LLKQVMLNKGLESSDEGQKLRDIMIKKISFSLVIGLMFIGQSFASTYTKPGYNGGEDDLFVSATIGTTSHSFGDNTNPSIFKENEISYGLEFDYRIARYFSVGLGYVNFGEAEQFSEVDVIGDTTETYSVLTAGNGLTTHLTWHTDTRDGPWYFFMRYGRVQWEVELINELSVTGGESLFERESATVDGSDNFTSFGGGYYFMDNLRIGLKMDYYNFKYQIVDPEDSTADDYRNGFDQVALTATYSF